MMEMERVYGNVEGRSLREIYDAITNTQNDADSLFKKLNGFQDSLLNATLAAEEEGENTKVVLGLKDLISKIAGNKLDEHNVLQNDGKSLKDVYEALNTIHNNLLGTTETVNNGETEETKLTLGIKDYILQVAGYSYDGNNKLSEDGKTLKNLYEALVGKESNEESVGAKLDKLEKNLIGNTKGSSEESDGKSLKDVYDYIG